MAAAKKIPRRTNTARRGEKRESSFSREQLALDKLAPHLPVRRESTDGSVGLVLSVLLSSPGGDPAGRAIFPRGQCSNVCRRLHDKLTKALPGRPDPRGRGPGLRERRLGAVHPVLHALDLEAASPRFVNLDDDPADGLVARSYLGRHVHAGGHLAKR